MIDRRKFLEMSAAAGASMALGCAVEKQGGDPLQMQSGQLIKRPIPSSGQLLPVIGLGFAGHAGCADPAALKEVLRTFFDKGGRVFDTGQTDDAGVQFHATLANELGIQDKLFWGMKGYTGTGQGFQIPASGRAHVESLIAMHKVSRLDLVNVPILAGPEYWAAIHAAKKEGRIRYVGAQVSVLVPAMAAASERIMRDQPIDFITTGYSLGGREAEERILPLALERKIAVLTFFPFGGASGLSCVSDKGLFGRVAGKPLPAWAEEFDAKTWAQFFLKYIISNPAVTAVRTGTTKPHHMVDNIGGGIGRLPDEATRKRMAAFIDALPPVTTAAVSVQETGHGPPGGIVLPPVIIDRYVGKYRTATGDVLAFRRYGTFLVAKVGPNEDTVIYGRTETRFQLGQTFIEFQLDSAGKATGLVYEQGSNRILAARIH